MDTILLEGNIELTSPVYNAAGPWAKTESQLQIIANSESGAIVAGTFTLTPGNGNMGNVVMI